MIEQMARIVLGVLIVPLVLLLIPLRICVLWATHPDETWKGLWVCWWES